MTVSKYFQHSGNLPIEKRIANLKASQERWVEMYGEPNKNLAQEIEALEKEKADAN